MAPDHLTKDVTVVIPCYNAVRFVGTAIDSCFAEGIPEHHVLVVDDGSTDATPDVLAGYSDRIRVHRTRNGGASRARQSGLDLVETTYVIFLDADDLYEGGMLAALEAAMRCAGADLGLGTTQVVRADGAPGPRRSPPSCEETSDFVTAWLSGQSIQTNSHMWRTAFLRDIGGWRTEMRTLEEIEIVARAVLKGARVVTTDTGRSLYIDRANEDRVSYGDTEDVIRSSLEGFANLEGLVGDRAAIRRALGYRHYLNARAAFRKGYVGLGRDALARARACGFAGHHGTLGHKALATLLGLERKETWRMRHLS